MCSGREPLVCKIASQDYCFRANDSNRASITDNVDVAMHMIHDANTCLCLRYFPYRQADLFISPLNADTVLYPLNVWMMKKEATRGPNSFDMLCTGSNRKSSLLQKPIHNLPTSNLRQFLLLYYYYTCFSTPKNYSNHPLSQRKLHLNIWHQYRLQKCNILCLCLINY